MRSMRLTEPAILIANKTGRELGLMEGGKYEVVRIFFSDDELFFEVRGAGYFLEKNFEKDENMNDMKKMIDAANKMCNLAIDADRKGLL